MARSRLDLHRGGTGEPLVLVHGIGHTWRGWKPMLPLLEPRFDVLAVDLPGFGHSPPLPPDGVAPTVEALADAVESELDAAGFDTAHLAGNSLGGWIALELARRRRARTVTAISPFGLGLPRENRWGMSILLAMR
jgi:pimeloyl-ACP methyl ester carboxylesterase